MAGLMQKPDGTPVRALVVDDEPTTTALLASVLRYEGWDIRTPALRPGAERAGVTGR